MEDFIEERLKIKGTPFDKRVTLNAVARRNICRVRLNDSRDSYDIIISAFYEDHDGSFWIQGVNISDLVDSKEDPDVSNLVFRTSDIVAIEFSDLSVYDVKMTKEQASSIMHRTDRIVKEAKSLVFASKENSE